MINFKNSIIFLKSTILVKCPNLYNNKKRPDIYKNIKKCITNIEI